MKVIKFILCISFTFLSLNSKGQNETFISGYIYTNEGNPISDASVILKDSYNKIIYFNISNSTGYYKINKPALDKKTYLMQVSHISFKSSLIKINKEDM